MRTADQAIDYARTTTTLYHDQCLGFVRAAYALPALGYPDASTAWDGTLHRGTGTAPRGALLWWTGGSEGHGHVAISNGDGHCYSTDFGAAGYVGDGRIRLIPIENVAKQSSCVYRGWSRDYGGNIFLPAPQRLRYAVRNAQGQAVLFFPWSDKGIAQMAEAVKKEVQAHREAHVFKEPY
jgi:hypothetical protein